MTHYDNLYDEPLYPIDLDLGVLLPDPDALQDTIDAHIAYDPPEMPLILSNAHVLTC